MWTKSNQGEDNNAKALRQKQAWPVQRAKHKPVWLDMRSERLAGPGQTGSHDHVQCDFILSASRRVFRRQLTGFHFPEERKSESLSAAVDNGLNEGERIEAGRLRRYCTRQDTRGQWLKQWW